MLEFMRRFFARLPRPERLLSVSLVSDSIAVAALILAFGLVLTGGAGLARAASPEVQAAVSVPRSAELAREIDAYRMCAKLNLPSDFAAVKDSASAAALALEKCRNQRYAVAGQFALDYPGTVRTRAFVDGLAIQLVDELSAWLEDVHAERVSPHPPAPRRR
jgi:hypothetical protein